MSEVKTAKFVNFTSEPFKAWWNGKSKVYGPGQGASLEAGIAANHAKHLTNYVLLQMGKDKYTSPKFPEQVPDFMEIYNKAYFPEVGIDEYVKERGEGEEQEVSKMPEEPKKMKTGVENEPSMVIAVPDEEDEFVPPQNNTPETK